MEGSGRGEKVVRWSSLEALAEQERSDSRRTWWALAAAGLVHVVLFATQWPTFAGATSSAEQVKPRVYVVQVVRFKEPERVETRREPRRVQIVPIPDPDPENPEPLDRDTDNDESIFPEVDPQEVLGPVPAPPAPERDPGPFPVGGKVSEPVKVFAPPPVYPKAALAAHLPGVVVLECIVDRAGTVTDVKVLRGAPLGMTEAAVEVVRTWRFKPSKLEGTPVDVIYVLTVHFRLTAG